MLIPGLPVFADSIAFFYALDQDLDALKRVAGGAMSTSRIGSRTVTRLHLHSHQIDAIKMGSGCVEAALSAQALLARKPYDLAISVGPAGMLSHEARTGEWYRVERVILWQKGSETTAGFQPNRDAGFDLGSIHESVLAAEAVRIAATGTIISGDAFIASSSRRNEISAMTGGAMVDMNSGGIAAACADHQTPLIMLRMISDEADESAAETFRMFLERYDGEGGSITAHLIAGLPPNPDAPASYPEIKRLLQDETRGATSAD